MEYQNNIYFIDQDLLQYLKTRNIAFNVVVLKKIFRDSNKNDFIVCFETNEKLVNFHSGCSVHTTEYFRQLIIDTADLQISAKIKNVAVELLEFYQIPYCLMTQTTIQLFDPEYFLDYGAFSLELKRKLQVLVE